jgi:hypothetical protein
MRFLQPALVEDQRRLGISGLPVQSSGNGAVPDEFSDRLGTESGLGARREREQQAEHVGL